MFSDNDRTMGTCKSGIDHFSPSPLTYPELTFVEFKDGEEPSNLAGGETYSFSSDSFDEFSFFDAGDPKYYIRINSNWYQVEENIDFFSDNRKLMQII